MTNGSILSYLFNIEINEENGSSKPRRGQKDGFYWIYLFSSYIKDSRWVYLSVGGGGVVYRIAVARCSAGRLERQS